MSLGKDGATGRFSGLVLILSLPFYALGATGAALPFVPGWLCCTNQPEVEFPLPLDRLFPRVEFVAFRGP